MAVAGPAVPKPCRTLPYNPASVRRRSFSEAATSAVGMQNAGSPGTKRLLESLCYCPCPPENSLVIMMPPSTARNQGTSSHGQAIGSQ